MTDPDAPAHTAELDDIIEHLYTLTTRLNHKDHRNGCERAMWMVSGIRDSIAGREGIKTPSPIDGIR